MTRSGSHSRPSGISSAGKQRRRHHHDAHHRNGQPIGQHAIGREAAEVIGGGHEDEPAPAISEVTRLAARR